MKNNTNNQAGSHNFNILQFILRVHNYMLLNKRFDIGTVICPRAVVLARGRISNLLFNDNFIT